MRPWWQKGQTMSDWRQIPGYGGAYEISIMGEVRTYRYRGPRLLETPRMMQQYVRKPRGKARRSGRRYVKLTADNGKAKEVAVLKIMVEVWCNGGPPGKVPYHKNGDLADHCLHNIGFATRKDLGKMTGAKSKRKPVAKIDQQGEIVEVYPSARAAARANNMSYQTVIDRCHGRVKRPYALDGHTYKYEE